MELADAGDRLRNAEVGLIQRERLSALGELASGLALELDQPLHLIQGYNLRAKKALRHRRWDELEDCLCELGAAASRMEAAIIHCRDYEEIASADFIPVSIDGVVAGAVELTAKSFRRREIHLEQRLSTAGVKVEGNALRLGRMLVNFLLNARDAFDEVADDRRRSVGIHTIVVEGSVQIDLRDNACGIPRDLMRRLFDPSFTTKPSGVGSGLGLPLARRIAVEHRGSVSVVSVLGEGTTVSVLLPASVD